MIIKLTFWIALGLSTASAFGANALQEKGCRSKVVKERGNFAWAKETPAGTLLVCGSGTAEKMHGHAYLEKQGKVERINFIGGFGRQGTASSLFSETFASLKEVPDGVEVTHLLPFDDQLLPGTVMSLRCTKDGCKPGDVRCVFKKPVGHVDADALRKVKSAWEAAPAEDSVSLPESEVKAVYQNALIGHRPSQQLLLDEKVIARLDERQKASPEPALHRRIHDLLLMMKATGCFPH